MPCESQTGKRNKLLIAASAGFLILLVGMTVFFSPTFVGGTIWQYDYQIQEVTINGQITGTTGYPDDPAGGGGGGGGGGTPMMSLTTTRGALFDVRTAYTWWIDIDGAPIYTGTAWQGLLPDIGVTLSLPWRVDKNGNNLTADAIDPFQVSHEVILGGQRLITWEYYYSWDIAVVTAQTEFAVPSLIPWVSCEAGEMEVQSLVRVGMAKRLFTSNVTGEFADCKVREVEVSNLQLQSGLAWVVVPKVDPQQFIGTGIPVQNRQQLDTAYTCDLVFTCKLTPGMVKNLLNNLPYDVWVRKVVQMTVLLTQPFEIGSTGGEQDVPDPPPFVLPLDLFTMILTILGVVIVLAVIVLLCRFAGVIGFLVRKGRH